MGDSSETPPMRVAAVQMVNAVGDLDGNAEQILEGMRWAEEEGADVVVFPELALTGYPLADLVLREDFVDHTLSVLEDLAARSGRTPALVGTVDRVPPRRSWDTRERTVAISQAVLCDGEIRGIYHKVLLPNYETFDEARNFAPGDQPDALWRIGETVAGISICEDLWSGDGPPERQAAAGARILLVPNASPFHREKLTGRRELAARVARRNGTPVVYVNLVGGHDELVFDGGSLVVDRDGDVLYRAAQFETARFCFDVPLGPPRRVTGPVTTVHARPLEARRPAPPPRTGEQRSDDDQVWEALVLGTRDFVRRNGATAATLGLSGGIDAAVTAAIAAEALGPGNVLGIAMPGPGQSEEELDDARDLAEGLGIGFRTIRLEGPGAELRDELAEVCGASTGTPLESRLRAAILWEVSDRLGHLPLATGNKSEVSIGAVALFGDMAGGFAPLKDCPKTLLYRLARLRNERGRVIPERILDRAPTQRNEDGDAPALADLDDIVERYVEKGQSLGDLLEAGFDDDLTRGVLQLIDDAELKRRLMPPGVKITARAFGQDLRMPITHAWRPFRAQQAEIATSEAASPAPLMGAGTGLGVEGLPDAANDSS